MNVIQPQSTLFRRRDGPPGGEGGTPFSSPAPAASHPARHATTGASAASSAANATAAQEQENDALMQALLSDMRKAKKGFTKLGDEVREQNALLERLKSTFVNAQGSLRRTMQNMDKIGWGSFKHMWVLALFVIIFFMLLYLMLRFR